MKIIVQFYNKDRHNLASLAAEQASFGNVTILNRENSPKNRKGYMEKQNFNHTLVSTACVIFSFCPEK